MSRSSDYIRKQTGIVGLDYSSHAVERMAERRITDKDVESCVMFGDVIEEQYYGMDVKVLFQEAANGKPDLYVVVADCNPPLVITVCRVKDDVWEYVDGKMKRGRM
ncbi:MAG TPA: DUF4258 domain-containing protein [Clostridia bacterium]|nr:DUF4258 domain-containing protein [Clostridia bacterium]